MNAVLFVTSHMGSDAEGLISILDINPRIEMFCPHITYMHPTDLEPLLKLQHKLSNTAAIYGDYLWLNAQFACKALYKICKFVYVIREAKPSLNEMVKKHGFSAERAYLYYAFRLRRICEMAKRTPGAVFLTWGDLAAGKGLPLIENYLRLKNPLEHNAALFAQSDMDEVPHEIIEKSQECYERHLYFLRNLQLLQTV